MILFFLGLIITNLAVFAELLGLDKNPGSWGKARTALFIVGCLIILWAVVYYRSADRVDALIRSFLGRLFTWMEVNQYTANLLSFFRKNGFTLPIVFFVVVIYVWFISSGTWTNWVSPTHYYANLARGFQLGHLFIPTQPDQRLSELPNPYDPSARVGIDAPLDITYYNGRYYLYWGPVPALILLAVQPLVHGRVGDLQLVFGFICGIFLAQFFILIIVWNRFFHRHPKWMLAFSIFLAGLVSPVTFMLNNYRGARIYEAAISGGQFFFVSGLLFIIVSLNSSLPSRWKLSLAGIFFALAIGTRLVLFIPVGIIAVLTALWVFKSNSGLPQKIFNLFMFIFPLVLGFASLGWYNWARFGSFTESGLYYQLAGYYVQKNFPDLFKPIYIYQNIYNYLISPFRLEAQFPFAYVEYGNSKAVFSSYRLPSLYTSQQITGLFYTVPFVVFSIIPFLALLSTRIKKQSRMAFATGNDGHLYNRIILALGASFLSAFGFLTLYFWTAMRYIEEFMPALIMLSVIGFWQGNQMLADKPVLRKYFSSFGFGLAAISIVMSNLIAISINDLRFLFIK
ncbi:MAG TPA: hypothetical protein VFI68_10195 [Anaerolineales bacterium]|nr:hypothetical protein [Anaerolineales bacterium]